jgi:hypothetical protein
MNASWTIGGAEGEKGRDFFRVMNAGFTRIINIVDNWWQIVA